MRRNALTVIPVVAALAACGGGKPAQSPENAPEEETSSSSDSSKSGDQGGSTFEHSSSSTGKKDPVVGVTVKDDMGERKKDAPCAGNDIADLAAIVAQTSCEVNDPKAETEPRIVKDVLDVTVATDAPKVAPGAQAKVTVTFHNKGKTPIPLDFAVDPEPRFTFEVFTPKGQRVDKPTGSEPALPPEVTSAPTPERRISRVLLAPQGNAKVLLSWDAVKYKWASKDKAKGALPGHGYPQEPAGPLTKGKYVLRVVLPLVGILEGTDHEVTQPRVNVEVAPQ